MKNEIETYLDLEEELASNLDGTRTEDELTARERSILAYHRAGKNIVQTKQGTNLKALAVFVLSIITAVVMLVVARTL